MGLSYIGWQLSSEKNRTRSTVHPRRIPAEWAGSSQILMRMWQEVRDFEERMHSDNRCIGLPQFLRSQAGGYPLARRAFLNQPFMSFASSACFQEMNLLFYDPRCCDTISAMECYPPPHGPAQFSTEQNARRIRVRRALPAGGLDVLRRALHQRA